MDSITIESDGQFSENNIKNIFILNNKSNKSFQNLQELKSGEDYSFFKSKNDKEAMQIKPETIAEHFIGDKDNSGKLILIVYEPVDKEGILICALSKDSFRFENGEIHKVERVPNLELTKDMIVQKGVEDSEGKDRPKDGEPLQGNGSGEPLQGEGEPPALQGKLDLEAPQNEEKKEIHKIK